MRVLVCGGRDYKDRKFLFECLDLFDKHWARFDVVIHGGASGADHLAHQWATEKRIPVREFPARWEWLDAPNAVIRYGKNGRPYNARAGHDRNWLMLTKGLPDITVAFPGGAGTADMVQLSEDFGLDHVVKAGWR